MQDLEILKDCCLCPRQCHVNRLKGEIGFCKCGPNIKIYRFGPHHGEEPPLSDKNGSGTIFFTGCTMRCIYCQNYKWSQLGHGKEYSLEEFIRICEILLNQRVNNLNFVTPTPWIAHIAIAVKILKQSHNNVITVCNTSGYERVEILKQYEKLFDIYLFDLRYSSNSTAMEASHTKDYVERSRQALVEAWKQVGALSINKDGIASKGVICRLLVLPGHENETIENLEWLRDNIGKNIAVSVMSQYTPLYKAKYMKPWNQKIDPLKYEKIVEIASEMRFTMLWSQNINEETEEDLIGSKMKGAEL